MLSSVTSHISAISDQIKNNKLQLASGIVVVSTSLLNHFLSKFIFKCPNSSHAIYGWAFLLCPGIILALLTLLGSPRLSRAVSGFCLTDNDVPKLAICGKRRRTWRFIIRSVSIALCMSILAFLSWVVVSLLTTETYVCIKLGHLGATEKYKVEKEKYGMKSKIAGLILLIVCLSVSLAINLALKCCFSDLPEKDLPSMRRYDKIEAQAACNVFNSMLETSADARGKAMVKRLLHTRQPKLSTQELPDPRKPEQKGQAEDEKESAEEFVSRDDIKTLRYFLAMRYPRLDGEEYLQYCRQDVIPETFDSDRTDYIPKYNETHERTEIAFNFVKDYKDCSFLCKDSSAYSWEPNSNPLQSINA